MIETMTAKEVQDARADAIILRDEALKQGQMEWAVTLSHTVKALSEYYVLLEIKEAGQELTGLLTENTPFTPFDTEGRD